MDSQLAAVAALIVAAGTARAFFAKGIGGFFICISDSAAIKINLASRRLLVGGRRDDGRRVRCKRSALFIVVFTALNCRRRSWSGFFFDFLVLDNQLGLVSRCGCFLGVLLCMLQRADAAFTFGIGQMQIAARAFAAGFGCISLRAALLLDFNGDRFCRASHRNIVTCRSGPQWGLQA